LRIEAELILNTGAANVEKTAEAKLLQSLDLAQAQSVSHSNFGAPPAWHAFGNAQDAPPKPVVSSNNTYSRFTEGFASERPVESRAG